MTTQTLSEPIVEALTPAPVTTEQFNAVIDTVESITGHSSNEFKEELFHSMGLYTHKDGTQHLVFASRIRNPAYLDLMHSVYNIGTRTTQRRKQTWKSYAEKIVESCKVKGGLSFITPLTIGSFFSAIFLPRSADFRDTFKVLYLFINWLDS